MWSVGSRPVDVFLGQTRVGLCRAEADVTWVELERPHDGVRVLAEQVAAAGGWRRARVWTSGAAARPFIAGPIAGVRRWSELKRVLEAVAPDATGLEEPCEVWSDGDATVAACLAVAMPTALLVSLNAEAKKYRVALRSIRPWWSAVLNRIVVGPRSPEMLVVEDVDSLTVLRGVRGCFAGASTCCPRPAEGQLEAWLTRLAVTHDLAPGAVEHWTMPGPNPTRIEPIERLDVQFGAVKRGDG